MIRIMENGTSDDSIAFSFPKEERPGNTTSVKDMLLDETAVQARREEAGNEDRYSYVTENSDTHVSVTGFEHTNEMSKLEDLEAQLKQLAPSIILTETDRPLEDYFPGKDIDTITAQEAAATGEQVYIAWLARKIGIRTQGWDLSSHQLITETLQQKNPDGTLRISQADIASWLVNYGTRSLLDRKQDVTLDNLCAMINLGMPSALDDLSLDRNVIAQLFVQETGYSFGDLADPETRKKCWQVVDEKSSDNAWAKFKNRLRDEHAVQVISEVLKEDRRIFLSAGVSHAITWEKAIEHIVSRK